MTLILTYVIGVRLLINIYLCFFLRFRIVFEIFNEKGLVNVLISNLTAITDVKVKVIGESVNANIYH